ncbi:MAG: type II toxin-antitoxin system VapB family antitoxin [Candidatus Competibacter sp.]|nr:type II toxin-antitoxin system VapB family antitoxin [Candidatus Competibacter sp.]
MNIKPERNTQVTVNADLIEQGLHVTKLKTRRELVNFALRELIRRENQKKLLELKGQVQWEGDLTVMRGGVTDDPC